jgi:hypothetical protein
VDESFRKLATLLLLRQWDVARLTLPAIVRAQIKSRPSFYHIFKLRRIALVQNLEVRIRARISLGQIENTSTEERLTKNSIRHFGTANLHGIQCYCERKEHNDRLFSTRTMEHCFAIHRRGLEVWCWNGRITGCDYLRSAAMRRAPEKSELERWEQKIRYTFIQHLSYSLLDRLLVLVLRIHDAGQLLNM